MKQSFKSIALILFTCGTVTALQGQHALYAVNTNTAATKKAVHNNRFVNETGNAKVSATFNRLFKAAGEVQWIINGQTSEANFITNGRKTKAVFAANGTLTYAITGCSLQQLPAALQTQIQKQYAGYSLLNAVEIMAYDAVAYQVILENETGYVTLKSTAEGVEEINTVTKL